jgi:hypothetical protein
MERGDLGTFAAVEADVRAGQALLWLVWNAPFIKAAAVTQLARSERSKVCMIVACGGEGMTLWLPLIEKIEAYARDEGCDAVRILGRKGWMRVLKDYRAPRVVLEKRLQVRTNRKPNLDAPPLTDHNGDITLLLLSGGSDERSEDIHCVCDAALLGTDSI